MAIGEDGGEDEVDGLGLAHDGLRDGVAQLLNLVGKCGQVDARSHVFVIHIFFSYCLRQNRRPQNIFFI